MQFPRQMAASVVVVVIAFVVVVRPTQTQLFGPKDKKGGLENEQSQNMSNNNSKEKGRQRVGGETIQENIAQGAAAVFQLEVQYDF